MKDRVKDLVGETFGDAVVLERLEKVSRTVVKWRCRCICGKEFVSTSGSIQMHTNLSCGCKKKKPEKSRLKGFSVEYLRGRFIYNPDTGTLVWRDGQRQGFEAGSVMTNNSQVSYRYLGIGIGGLMTNMLAHVIIYAIVTGKENFSDIDHIDGNGLNNTWGNLREVTRSENNKNQRGCRGASGVVGVRWSSIHNKWHASWGEDGKYRRIGTYDNLFDAVCARRAVELKNGFTERHGK